MVVEARHSRRRDRCHIHRDFPDVWLELFYEFVDGEVAYFQEQSISIFKNSLFVDGEV